MKLLDQVVRADRTLAVGDAAGPYRIAGASRHAPDLLDARCSRFVADGKAAEFCLALVDSDRGMLTGRNEFLHVPAPRLWLEWPCGPTSDGMSGTRTGVLVDADATGRAGTVRTFWEQGAGDPVAAQMIVAFDLDGRAPTGTGQGEGFALQAGAHPLAPHLLMHFQPEWQPYFDRQHRPVRLAAAAEIAANVLPGLEFLFAFSALLAERACLRRRDVCLARLNRQRARNGRAALLDHVEVTLDLAAGAATGPGHPQDERSPARLHSVRGHMVRRGGSTFWRRSHLRGDPARTGCTRTVRLTRR